MDWVNFQSLVKKYLEGKANSDEKKIIENYLESYQNKNVTWDSTLMGEKDSIAEELYLHILKEIDVRERKVRTLKFWRLSSAAAVFLILFSGLYIFYNRAGSVTNYASRYKSDIAPGRQKATLTLQDGSVLTLDTMHEGTVKEDHGVRITSKNGTLVYEVLNNNSPTIAYNVIQTPRGGKFIVLLPDGTKVWLNSETVFRYPTAFRSNKREVTLSGEAYFEVAKQVQKSNPSNRIPFIVKTGSQEVEVLGTHFNINSYQDEPVIKTSLLEGSVRITHHGSTLLLKPNEQAMFDNSATSAMKLLKNIDSGGVVAWKNDVFRFQDTGLNEIMRQLSRWYDVNIVYEGDPPSDEFTGYISRNVNISSVLQMLEQGGGVEFRIEGRNVIIKANN